MVFLSARFTNFFPAARQKEKKKQRCARTHPSLRVRISSKAQLSAHGLISTRQAVCTRLRKKRIASRVYFWFHATTAQPQSWQRGIKNNTQGHRNLRAAFWLAHIGPRHEVSFETPCYPPLRFYFSFPSFLIKTLRVAFCSTRCQHSTPVPSRFACSCCWLLQPRIIGSVVSVVHDRAGRENAKWKKECVREKQDERGEKQQRLPGGKSGAGKIITLFRRR